MSCVGNEPFQHREANQGVELVGVFLIKTKTKKEGAKAILRLSDIDIKV